LRPSGGAFKHGFQGLCHASKIRSCTRGCHPGRATRDPGSIAPHASRDRWVPGRARSARLPGMTAERAGIAAMHAGIIPK
jgi:hypothetical protein